MTCQSGIVVVSAVADADGTEDLLEEEETRELMGEGEAREGPEEMGAGLDGGIQPVGAADDEDDLAVDGGEVARELDGGEFASLLGEDDDIGVAVAVEFAEDGLTLLGDGRVGELADVGLGVGRDPLGEFVAARLERAVLESADDNELEEKRGDDSIVEKGCANAVLMTIQASGEWTPNSSPWCHGQAMARTHHALRCCRGPFQTPPEEAGCRPPVPF